MRKMTERQRTALAFIAKRPNGQTSAYQLNTAGLGNLATLRQLGQRGLVRAFGLGHTAFPEVATFQITRAGREAVSDAGDAQ